jgi:hypothetical protein
MSFDLIVLQNWTKTAAEETWGNEEGIPEDAKDRPAGPYECWEMVVVHPIEQRNYGVDLKFLGSHWRMRVYYKSLRDGLRFTKAIFPDATGTKEEQEQEAKFVALKYLHRYFQEQLAMYNAICVLHLGQKYTEVCDCEADHSQHMKDEFKPLQPYDGTYLRRKPAAERLPSKRANVLMDKERMDEDDMCEWCVGDIDIEAFIRYGLCPVCRASIPHPHDVVYGQNYDVTDEFLKWRKEKYDELSKKNKESKGDKDEEEGSR